MVLPAVDDEGLRRALTQVVAYGGELERHPSTQDDLQPLIYLAAATSSQVFPDLAKRVRSMLDAALIQNVESVPDGEPPLTEEHSHGLRILFGLLPDYLYTDVDVRREEAGDLLFPEQGSWKHRANTFYKTWQRPALDLAISCLKATYGQEEVRRGRRHESVSRSSWTIVGSDRRKKQTVTSHVSRSMLERLEVVRTRCSLTRDHADLASIDFEAISGVGPPEVIEEEPFDFRLRFPLLHPVGMGEEFAWSFQRTYRYRDDAPVENLAWMRLTGNVRGFSVSVVVTFEGEPPMLIWRFGSHAIRPPALPELDQLLRPDSDGGVSMSTTDTYPEKSYGIAWKWQI